MAPEGKRPRSPSRKTSGRARASDRRVGDARHLARRLGVTMRRIGLLRQAVTHKSAYQELDLAQNERLEFLGDAVLGLAIASHLYRSHPDLPEGDLTKVKAVAVSEQVLARVAEELELGRYLILSKGEEQSGGRARPSILADAVEAVFGAIYLDRGFTIARSVVLRLLESHLRAIEDEEYAPDYKTLLQEKVQEIHRATPSYSLIEQSGPDHDRTFVTEVRIGGRALGRGVGKSKKQAEQDAARDALQEDLSSDASE